MFEQLDNPEPEEAPEVSTAMTLGVAVAYLAGALGGACLFIALDETPFGFQIATAITYTYFAFWYIFFPTRGLLEKYSLRDKTVQRQLPRLLAIHCGFLAALLLGQIKWFAMKPYLSSYWFTEYGKRRDTSYELMMIVAPVLVFFAQVLISRRILSRSLERARPEAIGLKPLS